MKRYYYAFLYSLAALVLGYLMFYVTGLLCNWVYEALIEWFPSVFKDYSPVLDKKEFELAALTVRIVGSSLAIIWANVLLTKLDNGRDEYVTAKTEGFFRIREFMPEYYKRYALPDIISAFLTTALISALIIPAHLASFDKVSWFSNTVKNFSKYHVGIIYGKWGFVLGVVYFFALSSLSKLLGGISGLKKWRAAWLTYN